MAIKRIKVLYPITVPYGKYCWDNGINGCCDHFDNESGHESCNLGFNNCKEKGNTGLVLKAPECLKLKEDK